MAEDTPPPVSLVPFPAVVPVPPPVGALVPPAKTPPPATTPSVDPTVGEPEARLDGDGVRVLKPQGIT